MNKSDEMRIVEYLENEKLKLIDLLPLHLQEQFKEESFIAGGSIYSAYNNKPINDIDVFVESLELKIALNLYFKRVDGLATLKRGKQKVKIGIYKGRKLVITDNAITIGNYQIILRDVGQPVDVISKFDFKHNMYYIKNNKFYSVANISYLDSNQLIFNDNRSRDVAGALMRIPKFIEKGFTINQEEVSKMLLRLSKIGFNEHEIEALEGKTGSIKFGSGD